VRLGYDTYSLQHHDWTIFQHLEHADELRLDVVHSLLDEFESLEDGYLKQVKARADDLGLDLEIGIGSICPTSVRFSADKGSAVEQLKTALHVASMVGSRVVKCVLGGNEDRYGEIPLEVHIEGVIETCRAARDMAMDLGVKIAVENHAGDLQGRELAALVEEAGPEYVGVCIDSANPMWTIESPFVTLDHLAPYVVTSHVRDVAAWEHPRGAAVQWMVMGEGTIGIDKWAERFKEECKGVSFNLEVVPHRSPRVFPYLDPESGFWEAYPDTPAAEFAEFLKLVKEGEPYLEPMVSVARRQRPPDEYLPALMWQEAEALKKSVRYCQEVLGVGERWAEENSPN
jgi:sugar phosphate isomerase/epimerase